MEPGGETSEEHRPKMMRWANYTKNHIEGVRNGTVQIPNGQTRDFYIKKYLLDSIAGDDLQSLAFSEDYFVPEIVPIQKDTAMTRLNFEISCEELPEEIRHKLERFRDYLEKADISDRENYLKAKAKYKRMVDGVKKYINKDKSLGLTFFI